jgi:hypothetical protein
MAEVPSNRRTWLLAAGGGAVVLALVAGWLLFGTNAAPALDEAKARDTAAQFLARLRDGKADEAWQSTSAEFKSLQGRDTFRSYVRSKKALKSPAEFRRFEPKPGPLPLADCVFQPASGGPIVVTLGGGVRETVPMPTVMRLGRFRFFFYSNEGQEPPHIHVQAAENEAKYWLSPVTLSDNFGFRGRDLNDIEALILEHQTELLEAWNEYFGA